MKARHFLLMASISSLFIACAGKDTGADATGTFEADEVIVSSEIPGKLLSFKVEEGAVLAKDSIVGNVDALNISLQKEQIDASINALNDKTADVKPQIRLLEQQMAVQQSQMDNLLQEKNRITALVKADAATTKQLDDINYQITVLGNQMKVTRQQIEVQLNAVATQNRGILSEAKPLSKRAEQLNDQLQRSRIVNPINGIVLTKYAQEGEVTAAGKALYKIADLSTITLRAYLTAVQLPQVKLGQKVKVRVDDGAKKYKDYEGVISWVSDKAEFTPKTIQTKEERANLVYAIKVKVKNDGYLKIGMYGEVVL
jgi:HlyD family secretion protein